MKLESYLLHQLKFAYYASWIKCSEISPLRMNELKSLAKFILGTASH